MTRCGLCDGCRWGGTCSTAVYPDALTDLHNGAGTTWTKTDAGYVPLCACHGSKSKVAAAAAPAKAKRPSGAVSQALNTTPAEPIDEQTALRLLITWLRKIPKEKR